MPRHSRRFNLDVQIFSQMQEKGLDGAEGKHGSIVGKCLGAVLAKKWVVTC